MKLWLAIIVGKMIFWLSRRLDRGGGSAAPGYYALKIAPNLVTQLSRQIPANVIVTGTNGKTTTSKLLHHFAQTKFKHILRNQTGSNLERGVASSLINKANWFGQIKVDLAIWEVDEAAFNSLLPKLKPNQVLVLNAFRDQLDRYGEVDTVIKRWHQTLEKVNWPITAIINGSDPNLDSLLRLNQLNPQSFVVDGHQISWEKIVKKAQNKVKPIVKAKILRTLGLNGTEFELEYPTGKQKVLLQIPGVYHVYDLAGAISVGLDLGIGIEEMVNSLESFKNPFGRVEKVQLGKHPVTTFLIKNPVGASLVFETIKDELSDKSVLLMALNDNFADGTDVSWIWDANFEDLATKSDYKIVCSGLRAEDFAVRLKYAGIDPKRIIIKKELAQAVDESQKTNPDKIIILPTYTALLQLQKIFTQMKVKNAYWSQES